MARAIRPTDDVTIEQWERALDLLARAIDKGGENVEAYFPLWNRVEKEIQLLREKKDIRSAVRERIKRSEDQRAA